MVMHDDDNEEKDIYRIDVLKIIRILNWHKYFSWHISKDAKILTKIDYN